jgi:hypothetical protein
MHKHIFLLKVSFHQPDLLLQLRIHRLRISQFLLELELLPIHALFLRLSHRVKNLLLLLHSLLFLLQLVQGVGYRSFRHLS